MTSENPLSKYFRQPQLYFKLPSEGRWYPADSLEMPVEAVPEFLQTFEGAIQSACWFWEANNLNQYADTDDILTMTKRINGGTIGLEDRKAHYEHAKEVLGE